MIHPSCDIGAGLVVNQTLQTGQCLVSPNGRYRLLNQTDGNLVLYDMASAPEVAMWSTGTFVPPLSPGAVLSTFYSFDALGHLLQVVQGQQTRTYQYDSLGHVTSATIPETGYQASTASYTDFGAVSQSIDPRVLPGTNTHITTVFGYDNFNRLQTVTYNDGTPGVTYTYNPPNAPQNTGGRLAKITNGISTETYQYDIMGRPKSSSKTIAGQTYAIGYQYHPDGSLASIA
jgi:YD repeat-containing protein